jgi:hypothetical protein
MPANERSINIMGSTGTSMNLTGSEVRYDSWYGYTDGFGTIMTTYHNFVGTFFIEASLSLTPGSADWFGIVPQNIPTSSNTEFVVSERTDPDSPTDFKSNGSVTFTDPYSGTVGYSIQGNFTYVRVRLDRSTVGDGNTYDPSYGQINRVILST